MRNYKEAAEDAETKLKRALQDKKLLQNKHNELLEVCPTRLRCLSCLVALFVWLSRVAHSSPHCFPLLVALLEIVLIGLRRATKQSTGN